VEIWVLCRIRGSARQGAAAWVTGLIRNLSEGGLMLELPQARVKGATLEVSLRTDDARVLAVAEVVWVGPPEAAKGGQSYRHGVHFARMAREQRSAIRRFIAKRFPP
jgi:hypothetical protein